MKKLLLLRTSANAPKSMTRYQSIRNTVLLTYQMQSLYIHKFFSIMLLDGKATFSLIHTSELFLDITLTLLWFPIAISKLKLTFAILLDTD